MKQQQNKITKGLILLVSIISVVACNDPYLGLEKNVSDSVSPGRLVVDKVVPKAGALEIFFTLPKEDADIARVVASYTNKRNENVETAVSRYSTSILVEGFFGIDEKKVNLVCEDNSGNQSEITEVRDSPLLSPVEMARQSMVVEEAFGGVRIDWDNISGDMLVIHVLTDDTLQIKGETVFVEDVSKRIYTRDTLDKQTFAYVRQYPDMEQRFGFTISDKWGNSSDTLVGNWTPYREDVIDYRYVSEMDVFGWRYSSGKSLDYYTEGIDPVTGLQRDGLFYGGSYRPKTLFDNSTGNAFFCTRFTKNANDNDASNDTLVPVSYITFNLNVDTRLSRMVVYPRPNDPYAYGTLKRFRIWGTDDNNPNRWTQFPEGWKLVGEFVSPDAAIPGNPTDEEIVYVRNNGYAFDVKDDNVSPDADYFSVFRYMRLEMMETYNPDVKNFTPTEMKLWGLIENEYY
ncbi:MAG: DUF5126 domain-containing protein [Alphaproteobacteria bacterium]